MCVLSNKVLRAGINKVDNCARIKNVEQILGPGRGGGALHHKIHTHLCTAVHDSVREHVVQLVVNLEELPHNGRRYYSGYALGPDFTRSNRKTALTFDLLLPRIRKEIEFQTRIKNARKS